MHAAQIRSLAARWQPVSQNTLRIRKSQPNLINNSAKHSKFPAFPKRNFHFTSPAGFPDAGLDSDIDEVENGPKQEVNYDPGKTQAVYHKLATQVVEDEGERIWPQEEMNYEPEKTQLVV